MVQGRQRRCTFRSKNLGERQAAALIPKGITPAGRRPQGIMAQGVQCQLVGDISTPRWALGADRGDIDFADRWEWEGEMRIGKCLFKDSALRSPERSVMNSVPQGYLRG